MGSGWRVNPNGPLDKFLLPLKRLRLQLGRSTNTNLINSFKYVEHFTAKEWPGRRCGLGMLREGSVVFDLVRNLRSLSICWESTMDLNREGLNLTPIGSWWSQGIGQGNKQGSPRKCQDRLNLGAKIVLQELLLSVYCTPGPGQDPEDVGATKAEALLFFAQSCKKDNW